MSVEFMHPLRLLALPVCAAVILAICLVRKSRSLKEKISHILRHVIITLAALALAGMSLLTASPDRTAFLLVDVSASVNEEETVRLAREALEKNGDRKTGVIAFGGNAAVERPIGRTTPLGDLTERVDRSASDLNSALQLASALLPADSNGGIAVISDGRVTGEEGFFRSAGGVPVNVLKTETRSGTDAQVTSVSVPSSLYTGQKYTAVVTVHANAAGEAMLLLTRDRGETQTRTVTLRKGENTFAFDAVAGNAGVCTIEAQVLMDGDSVSANDSGAAYTVIAGEPSVLIAEGQNGAGAALEKMLAAASIQVRVIPQAMLPEQAADLMAYHAVALVNADADRMTEGQIAALDAAAKELGVGVAVFGGDSSYALGGYRGSKLEEMLPVTIDVKNRMELPTTALVLVIDKSGSMTDSSYGVTRLQLAREAACAALEVLNERDQAGVIAFDDAGKWVIPVSYVTDVSAMQEQVATIRPGGGTAFYTPLVMAYEALKMAKAQYKHVIFLTDGEAGDTGYMDIVRKMAGSGITVTTVAVGDGADYRGMAKIAEIGQGRMYAAGPFDSLPRIFTKETMMISGAYVQNRVFTPAVTDSGMTDFPGFPELAGYLAVTEKPLATVALCSDRQDPILAWWQYGAGRVLCWTSDVQGGWSSAFLSWDRAAEFFSGMISFILPDRSGSGEITLGGGRMAWETEAPAEASAAAVTLIRPDGEKETLRLERVSESRFEGETDTALAGAYAARIEMEDGNGHVLKTAEGGGVVNWTGEYDQRQEDTGALETLAQETGGRVCESTDGLLEFPDMAARKRTDLTSLLAGLALLLFLFDAAQRRLDLFREPVKKETAEEAKPAPAKKQKPVKQKTEKETQAAADVLWEQMKNKKKL
ncbi:MAG: VWA domain-containing protein [Clostridiales bacterium]|nr:VWA domain-containing protein [Clostridiales bacterium]